MASKYPRLFIRNHTYYLRTAVPRELQYLVHKQEFKVSLKTNSYYNALIKYRKESVKMDAYIQILRDVDMEIRDNQLVLTDDEVNQIIKMRIKEVLDFDERNHTKIKMGKIKSSETILFNKDNMDECNKLYDKDNQITDVYDNRCRNYATIKCVKKWLKTLKASIDTHPSAIEIIDSIESNKDIKINKVNTPRENKLWLGKLLSGLVSADMYALSLFASVNKKIVDPSKKQEGSIADIKKILNEILLKVNSTEVMDVKNLNTTLLNAMSSLDNKRELSTVLQNLKPDNYSRDLQYIIDAAKKERADELNGSLKIKTTWDKLFESFAQHKRSLKKISERTVSQDRSYLETIFVLMGNPYIEEITYKDCSRVSLLIHEVPTKWQNKVSAKKLVGLIEKGHEYKKLSTATIINHLSTFRGFLKYAKKQRYIAETFEENIDLPKKEKGNHRERFTLEELQRIFNPEIYPSKNNIYYPHRFWVPLISVFSGMRLNEICQLLVDDIKKSKGIYYIWATNEDETQSLKTTPSKRIVPIHPKLIELGFIDFVNEQKKNKVKMLFDKLSYSDHNKYNKRVGSWFNRYLDKTVGINNKDKVFHSFRHTVKQELRDAGVSKEYQNSICGWSSRDIGERVYGGQVPVEILYKEICKLKYPCLDKIFEQIKNG